VVATVVAQELPVVRAPAATATAAAPRVAATAATATADGGRRR